MHLRVHDDPARFLVEAGAFLRAAEAENSIIATPVARMVAAPDPEDGSAYLACVASGGSVVAAALQRSVATPLLLTAGPERAFGLFAADIAERGRRPKGVVGPLASCEAFVGVWRERTSGTHALRFRLRHHALTALPSMPRARGSMRRPEPSEHELIAEWQTAFIVEVGLPDDADRVRSLLPRRLEQGLIRLWEDGSAVAFAGYAEAADGRGRSTARIGPVYTPPERRGRGYASALVAALSRELMQNGKRAVYLTTDLANPTSNSIYRRIGYRPVADHWQFDLFAASAGASA